MKPHIRLAVLKRFHSGHHPHHHSHEISSNREASLVTQVGLASNVSLTIAKAAAGFYYNSSSLIADSIHSLSDLLSDFVTLATIKWAGGKSDKKDLFVFGRGKAQPLGGLLVSSLLGVGALGSLQHSLSIILPFIESSHVHEHSQLEFGAAALSVALGSVLVKEGLFQWTNYVGKKQKSQVLIANAWHHRADALSSIVALVSLGGNQLLGVEVLDPLGGIVISGLVLRIAYTTGKSSCLELLDVQDVEVQTAVANLLKNSESFKHIPKDSIRVRKTGSKYDVSLALPEQSLNSENVLKLQNIIRKGYHPVNEINFSITNSGHASKLDSSRSGEIPR